MKVIIAEILLKYYSEVPHMITAWSGSFSIKLVYDIYKRVGIDFEKTSRKPFIVEPLIHNDKYIFTGIYKKDNGEYERVTNPFLMKNFDVFKLRIIFTDYELFQKFIEAFTMKDFLEEPAGKFIAESVNIREKELPNVVFNESGSKHEFAFKIRYLTPTNFIFHAWEIAFPSPIRLLYNISKNYMLYSKENHKESIEKIMLNGLEIMDVSIKKVYVDIGEGRKVPCFIGSAKYIACEKEGYIKALINLFEWAEILGVGKSKSLGFGRIKLEVI
jgi:CRISPR-associated endoribonuclease Cas6